MKILYIAVVFICGAFTINPVTAQVKQTSTIKVWGNCGMCKSNIEKAAKKAGANTASWSEDTHQLKFSYAVAKTSPIRIQEAVAKAGYDTQDVTADDKAYKKLHACCQYDRKAIDKKE